MNDHSAPFSGVMVVTVGIIGLVVGIIGAGYLNLVITLGRNIPSPDLAADYVTALIWAIALGLTILVWPISSRDKVALVIIWTAKSLVALGGMLLAESYFPAMDGFGYFNAATNRATSMGSLQFGAGTKNMVVLAGLHNQVISESYHALKVSFSMVGLVAIFLFYRAGVLFLRRENIRLLYVLAFFPSIIFWSSIVGKDPITLFGISLYVYGFVGWSRRKRMCYLLMLVAGVVVASSIRLWLGPVLLVPVVAVFWFGLRSAVLKSVFMACAMMGSWLFLKWFINVASPQELIAYVNVLSTGWAHDGGSGQQVREFTNIWSMAAFMPLGAFTALFRPLPGEVLNPFGILAGLENFFLLIVLSLAIKRTRWKELKEPIVLWAVVFVVTWSILYGFASYQNLGTAVRFKLQILPVLLGVLMYLARRRRRWGPMRPTSMRAFGR